MIRSDSIQSDGPIQYGHSILFLVTPLKHVLQNFRAKQITVTHHSVFCDYLN